MSSRYLFVSVRKLKEVRTIVHPERSKYRFAMIRNVFPAMTSDLSVSKSKEVRAIVHSELSKYRLAMILCFLSVSKSNKVSNIVHSELNPI